MVLHRLNYLMKINVTLIICLFAGVLLQTSPLKAQEAGSPSFEKWDRDAGNEREKAIAHPELLETPKLVTDSIVHRQRNVYKPSPVVPKAQNAPGNEEQDDSILSFNFLYYLFQKYKMQDILE